MKVLLVLIAICLFLSGCVELQDSKSKESPPPAEVVSKEETNESPEVIENPVLVDSQIEAPPEPEVIEVEAEAEAEVKVEPVPAIISLHAEVLELEGPDQYAVQIKYAGPQKVGLRRTSIGGEEDVFLLEGESGTWQDTFVKAGGSYQYELLALHDQGPELLAQTEVKIPIDRVLSTLHPLDPQQTVETIHTSGRLFLSKMAIIRTLGKNLSIQAKKIVVEPGARIETFNGGKSAEPAVDGRAGGSIEIAAESAVGELQIFLRGENGGPGHNGTRGAPISGVAAAGQNAVYVPILLGNFNFPRILYNCQRPATNGAEGRRGASGSQGGPGGNGGTAGNLRIQVQDANDFLLLVTEEPGQGGAGGRGGPGGPGQIGGPGGDPRSTKAPVLKPCPATSKGPNGPGSRRL